ncbi:SDR family NAD(P)-dependent oxidoreductase [Methylobacterium sp. P1-11]|uniref:SDR family NAD(P)-dependent oxidoreductase n=1 Tax=Methylobacterium sp. P1-11 TaxID=2024616 RepID=UPI0011EE9232|nr:SDR family NAD(P)-dependent oxidoreductase [Methylobacterium sp. P1-11]KAA0115641.1 SDR family NAD(P)-dependent oxidoreductase [Methylobacterium sp. P1-11]
MTRILITGSSDGLGLMAGQRLACEGHEVVLHARNADRGEVARRTLPNAAQIVIGDVVTIAGMRSVAEQANAIGRFDAVIHNVGIGYREAHRIVTKDGLSHLFAINVLAPYVLTALMEKPDRLVYLSSGMHPGGIPDMDDLQWSSRRWSGSQAYAETKFLDVLLAFGVARRWPAVRSNALEPGWVPTRMGGPSAPDDMAAAPVTQAWLAVGDDPATHVTGRYFYHQRKKPPAPGTESVGLQEALLHRCATLSGVPLP